MSYNDEWINYYLLRYLWQVPTFCLNKIALEIAVCWECDIYMEYNDYIPNRYY